MSATPRRSTSNRNGNSPRSPASNVRSSPKQSRSYNATTTSSPSRKSSNAPSSYFTFPVTYSVNGLLRRLSGDTDDSRTPPRSTRAAQSSSSSQTDSLAASLHSLSSSASAFVANAGHSLTSAATYTPAPPQARKLSPFQPPPLTPLTLTGWTAGTQDKSKLLTRALAEEIRLLLPARLQLIPDWNLVFSLEQDGVSLATLYTKCDEYKTRRGGFVLVVKDGTGGEFGAYLTDVPHPSAHYFGTGECFLWRASILPSIPDMLNLPPPPSADTTHATRMTTLGGNMGNGGGGGGGSGGGDGTTTPDRIRFKAFPYSGINDYMIFCETGYLSVGGG